MGILFGTAETGWPLHLQLVACLVAGIVAVVFVKLTCFAPSRPRKIAVAKPSPKKYLAVDSCAIEALAGFDWKTVEPRKVWNIKPKYHMTMGLQADTPSQLITIDRDYLDRISLRRNLIAEHGPGVLGCVPGGEPAVSEIYLYLMSHYLPSRYPTMFRLHSGDKTLELENLVTNKRFPTAPPEDPVSALRIIGETVEEDMFFLKQTQDGHRVLAFLCCFPSGFDPAAKLDKLLAEVHGPVPAYEKIGSSMERYFGRLEVGKNVKRTNWSIQTHDVLLNNHPHGSKGTAEEKEKFNPNQTFFRSELQTLSRLPQSGFILFSFKTYFYPVEQLKNEGLGPDLADAISGLDQGNAQGMWNYKGAGDWGEQLIEHLRS